MVPTHPIKPSSFSNVSARGDAETLLKEEGSGIFHVVREQFSQEAQKQPSTVIPYRIDSNGRQRAGRLRDDLRVERRAGIFNERLAVREGHRNGHVLQDFFGFVFGHQESFRDGLRVDAWEFFQRYDIFSTICLSVQ